MIVTMKDIAKHAGVSRPAVSLVLNDRETKHVSAEKKERILKAINELDYRPNYSARRLRGASTKTVGIVGALFGVPVHDAIANAIMNELQQHGYQTLLGDTGRNKDIIREFESRGVDAFIFTSGVKESILETINRPILRVTHNLNPYDIAVDMHYGGYLAGKHLIDHGHKKISYVCSANSLRDGRLDGLKKAMVESGMEPKDQWLLDTNRTDFDDYIQLLIHQEKVTAFFTLNDYLAASLIKLLKQQGITVPGDMAVIGFDGLPFTKLCIPSITTIVQPVSLLAQRAVAMLINKLEKKEDQTEVTLIAPYLEKGASCGCEEIRLESIESYRKIIPSLDRKNTNQTGD